MSYLEAKAERNAALLRMLHGIDSEESLEQPEGKVDFDGGVRQPAPPPANPEQDHNAFVVQLLGEHRGDRAGDFWPMESAKSSPAEEAGGDGEDWRKDGT